MTLVLKSSLRIVVSALEDSARYEAIRDAMHPITIYIDKHHIFGGLTSGNDCARTSTQLFT